MTLALCAATGSADHECGYCKSTSKSVGMWAYQMPASNYMSLIDYGWRRSGQYLYKPTQDTCCPQYSIRMTLDTFYPQKQIRRAINHFNFDNLISNQKQLIRKNGKVIRRPNIGNENLKRRVDMNSQFHIPQPCLDSQSHSNQKSIFHLEFELFRCLPFLKIVIEPSAFDQDTFDLYQKYQQNVHKDKLEELTKDKYSRFLVDHPFQFDEPFGVPDIGINNTKFNNKGFGFYHLKIYVHGELKAVSFIDILPNCVSSVYSIYANDSYEWGKITACYEIYVARQLSLQIANLKYFYLGFYIDNCIKMKYKSIYKPCFLLDPVFLQFVPFDVAIPNLRKSKKYTKLMNGKASPPDYTSEATVGIILNNECYSLERLKKSSKSYKDIVLALEKLPRMELIFVIG